MAATPSLPEVLAISDKGNLDLANLPNNGIRDFVSLLGDYVEEPVLLLLEMEKYTQ